MSAITDFYFDEASWDKTKPLNPSGYSHFDIVNNWSDEQWEKIHDFIQWVFPLQEPSNFNPDAPLLSAEDIALFQSNQDLQDALFKSFHRFLKFLGLRCRLSKDGETDANWIVEKIKAGECGIGDEFFTNAQIEEKMKVWESPNHNWLRITRCLQSLRLLGLEFASTAFFVCLCDLYNTTNVSDVTFDYWSAAAGVNNPIAQGGVPDELSSGFEV